MRLAFAFVLALITVGACWWIANQLEQYSIFYVFHPFEGMAPIVRVVGVCLALTIILYGYFTSKREGTIKK